MNHKAFTFKNSRTWSLVTVLGEVGSDSDVDKVGVLGSS